METLFVMAALVALGVFLMFGNLGDWLKANAELAKEETRKLKLDNDEREKKLKGITSAPSEQ